MSVAIMGYGTVGTGTAEVLAKNGLPPKYILDIRDFPGDPFESAVTSDFERIIGDPDIKAAAETIGGRGAALEFTKRLLAAGKSVVTSNKELVAAHGDTLFEIAKQSGARYFFEAAVGGGTPLIRPIEQSLAANRITEVTGILNGTTNYILTKMKTRSYADALDGAIKNGYAERDPSDDISGKDVCRKLSILASLVTGTRVPPESIATAGIDGVTAEDVAWGEKNGFALKLLARFAKTEGGKIAAYVAPHYVPFSNPLSRVDDVYNGVLLCCDFAGDVMFYGRGAGKLATASAVVSDIFDALNGAPPITWGGAGAGEVSGAEDLEKRNNIYILGG